MNETKHTPGKWEPNDSCPWIVTVRDKENVEQHIAWCYGGTKTSAANARLIAKAPELLAALEWIVQSKCYPNKDGQYPCMSKQWNYPCAFPECYNKLIAEAKGEKQ